MMEPKKQQEEHKTLEIGHTDKIASILLLCLSIGVFMVSRSFTGGITRSLGPAFFPRFIMIAIAILALIQFTTSLRSEQVRTMTISVEAVQKVIIPVFFLAGYIIVLSLLGFFLTTSVFLITFMYYSGVRKLRFLIPLPIIISIVLQNVFVGFLQVPLPTGTLPVRDWLSIATISVEGVFF